jgi:hypothetical protein
MADRAKFLDFLDMIDGGGAGKMGDKFEGGGIFSMLANAIATPYGSEDEARKRARMQAHGLLSDKAPAASIMSTPTPAVQPVQTAGQLSPRLDTKGMTPVTSDPRGFAPNTQPTFSTGRQYNPALSYANMPMGEVGRGVAPAPSAPAPAYANMPMGEAGRGMMPAVAPAQNMPQTMTAPASGVAPNMPMPFDPMVNAQVAPNRIVNPSMTGSVPRIDAQGVSVMSFEQFAPFISEKYKMEYGVRPTAEQVQNAYKVYRQNMGM